MARTHELSQGAGHRRPVHSREVVGLVETVAGCAPLALVYEVVPVGNQIAQWASFVAERNTAVHTACALLAKV